MSVTKEYQMLVENEILNKKISSLVSFWNKIFTTCQISNQVFYNVSVFKTKFSQLVRFQIKNFKTCRFCLKNFFQIRFCTKMCIQKITFWLNLPRKRAEFCKFCAFSKRTILTQKKAFFKASFLTKTLQRFRFWNKKFKTRTILWKNKFFQSLT